jgi:SAM-dependent methyltransferase
MSEPAKVDYDQVASNYNQRFEAGEYPVPLQALAELAGRIGARRVLELGCGTGRSLLRRGPNAAAPLITVGLDFSEGMLQLAKQARPDAPFVRAGAQQPPFASDSFDLVYSHLAFHHFPNKRHVAKEAFRLLRPGGAFAVVTDDPRESDWYLYDYFEGAREIDLERCPSKREIEEMLSHAGFSNVESPVVDDLDHVDLGDDVLTSYFIRKDSVSTLILLPQGAYDAGLARIHAELATAAARGGRLEFRSHLQIRMVYGFKPA